MSNDDDTERYEVSLELARTGGTTGELLPYTLKVPHFNIDESGVVLYGKTQGHTGGDEFLDKKYSIPTNNMFYSYNGNNTFTITGREGCIITAKALNSGLGDEEQLNYDVMIQESTCETDEHSTGNLFIEIDDSMYILGVAIQLKHQKSYFAGIVKKD